MPQRALSPDFVSVTVMEQFAKIAGAAQPVPPIIVGDLFSSTVNSPKAITLWNGGGCAPADWNRCDVVARAITLHLDQVARGGSDGGMCDATGKDE